MKLFAFEQFSFVVETVFDVAVCSCAAAGCPQRGPACQNQAFEPSVATAVARPPQGKFNRTILITTFGKVLF